MGDALECENLNHRVFIVGSSRRGVKGRQYLRIHPAPQKRFRLQCPEFPGPFWTRSFKSFAFLMGLVLTLFQVAMQETLVSSIKSNLRVVGPTASRPAGEN